MDARARSDIVTPTFTNATADVWGGENASSLKIELVHLLRNNINCLNDVLTASNDETGLQNEIDSYLPKPDDESEVDALNVSSLIRSTIDHLHLLHALKRQLQPLVIHGRRYRQRIQLSQEVGTLSTEEVMVFARRLTNTCSAPAGWTIAGDIQAPALPFPEAAQMQYSWLHSQINETNQQVSNPSLLAVCLLEGGSLVYKIHLAVSTPHSIILYLIDPPEAVHPGEWNWNRYEADGIPVDDQRPTRLAFKASCDGYLDSEVNVHIVQPRDFLASKIEALKNMAAQQNAAKATVTAQQSLQQQLIPHSASTVTTAATKTDSTTTVRSSSDRPEGGLITSMMLGHADSDDSDSSEESSSSEDDDDD
eukprot:Filipodium_phascolosomae@DN7433_c0_g1_i1.p1